MAVAVAEFMAITALEGFDGAEVIGALHYMKCCEADMVEAGMSPNAFEP